MSVMSNPDRLALLTQLAGTLELIFGKGRLGVWRVEGKRVVPLYGLVETRRGQRGSVPRLCRLHAEALRAGRTVRAAGDTLLPLMGEAWVGVVHVAGEIATVPDLSLPVAHAALDGLARVMVMPDVPPVELTAFGSARTRTTPEGAPGARGIDADAKVVEAKRTLDDSRRSAILHCLRATEWNVSESARRLGMGRTKLWALMTYFGLKRPHPAPTTPRRAQAT